MSRTEEVIGAYEAWDPDEESSSELAERLGISKARLYQILDKEGVTPKARRPARVEGSERGVAFLRVEGASDLVDEITERGVRSLLVELRQLREEIARYRDRYGPLDA